MTSERIAKYDPDQPRDDHGMWASGGGSAGGDGPSPKERAAASMQNPTFRAEHAQRLEAADAEARGNFPRDPHSEDANRAASNWSHSEAARIHAEQDAHGGDAELKQHAEDARSLARVRGGGLQEQHDAAMEAIANEKTYREQERSEQAARDAGAVPALPHSVEAAVAEHEALRAADDAKLAEIGGDLHGAHEQALTSLHELHGLADEEQADRLPSAYGLADHFAQTQDDLRGGEEHGYHEQLDAIGDATGREPIEPPEGIEINEDTGKPEPWSPNTYGYTEAHERMLSINEDTGVVHPWSHELFGESDASDGHGAEKLEFDEHGRVEPWSPIEGHAPHEQAADRAEYEAAAAAYERAAAEHKAEYDRVAADYEQHRAADQADHEAKVAQYNHAVAQRARETQAKAEEAQAHLEALHEKQVAAMLQLRDMNKAEDRSSAKAQREIDKVSGEDIENHVRSSAPFHGRERDEEGDYHDPSVNDLYHVAHDAYRSDFDRAEGRLSDDGRPSSLGDTHDNLKESAKATASAIRELARFSGRAPRIGKPVKKSANRPGPDRGASVRGMAALARFKLSLKSLQWISLVDAPAQEPAAIRLIKRKDGVRQVEQMEAQLTARVVWPTAERLAKLGDTADPLVYGWAFTCTAPDGGAYHDLQGDAVQPDFLKAAEEWLRKGGGIDEMHDGAERGSYAAFAFPWDTEIASALLGPEVGKLVKTSGLMIAVRPTAEQLLKLRSGEYNGFSIAGTGIRELVKAATKPKCEACGKYGSDGDEKCASCGGRMAKRQPRRIAPHRHGTTSTTKAAWTTADIDQLPDSSFLYVEPGGSEDAAGKTTPRSLRHFPYRDASSKIDIDHLRDAIGRIPQSSLPKAKRDELQVKAERLLAKQHDKAAKRIAKADQGGESTVVATSEVDGHQHTVDLDDPADGWNDQLATSYNTAADATNGHSHGWVFDPATGKITILADSGHTHTVDPVVPADVIRRAQLNESGARCDGCGEMCEADAKFCPGCGRAMDRAAVTGDSDEGPAVVIISARAPAAISTPSAATSTVKGNTEEHQMTTELNDKIRALQAENALLKGMSTLTDAARMHYDKLVAKGVKSDADAFLALTKAQRDVVLAEIARADAEVYTSKSTGRVYRQSDHLEIIEAAKQADAMAETMKRLETERNELEFAKRGAAMIGNFHKGAKGNLQGRIMKAVAGEFTDPAEYAEAEKALKAADAAFAMLTKSVGYTGDDAGATSTPAQAFEVAVRDFAKRNNLTYPVALERATATDPEVRRLYDEAQRAAS